MSFSKSKKISKYFSEYEVFHSDKAEENGLDNSTEDREILGNIANTAWNMDRIRESLGEPIKVTSWFRSLPVNVLVGSKNTSQHVKGEAIDVKTSGRKKSNKDLLSTIYYDGEFDQLIAEYPDGDAPKWIHVSFKRDPSKNRGIVAVIDSKNGYRVMSKEDKEYYIKPVSKVNKVMKVLGFGSFLLILGFLLTRIKD